MEPSTSTVQSSRTVTDLDIDTLAHCASYLDLRDISNMAMTCKLFKTAAYSDSIWRHWFRERWPLQLPSQLSQRSGIRDVYLARRTALLQFKFIDPVTSDFFLSSIPYNILLEKNNIIISQGSEIQLLKINSSSPPPVVTLTDHNARITCMRLFSLNETSLFRSGKQKEDSVLVTSSCDHSIRLWWKDHCQRCFRGHNSPVFTLSDKLLGDGDGKVLASGGEDGTVRLWSLTSSAKRGQHALKTTFYGHEKPVTLLSVAGHKTSLLVSISKDSKVKVWDTTVSSSTRSSGCVGKTSLLGAPVDVQCYESLFYVASGTSVTAIDFRTMQKVATAAVHKPRIYSFRMLPSKSLICTGGNDKVMLWDVRRCLKPVAELEGHVGPVMLLHMDPYKVVIGGPKDPHVRIWETDTCMQTNSLICCSSNDPGSRIGCSAMAVNGFRIVTASCDEEPVRVCYRDFSSASDPVALHEDDLSSKFWEPQSYTDGSAAMSYMRRTSNQSQPQHHHRRRDGSTPHPRNRHESRMSSQAQARTAALKDVAQETLKVLPRLLSQLQATEDARAARKYSKDDLRYLDPNLCPAYEEPATVRVVNEDTLNAAIQLNEHAQSRGNDPRMHNSLPLVVNFANANKPCGGWLNGKVAQEEALCYRSSLSQSLDRRLYPLAWDELIYSHYVLVMRDDMASGHRRFLTPPDEMPTVSCLTVAALRDPKVRTFVLRGGHDTATPPREKHIFDSDKDRSVTKAKMRLTLRAAATQGHGLLVLGALGCGVHANPPEDVAHCWLEVMRENEFSGNWWREVWFAVYDPRGDGNFDVFDRVLSGQQV